MFFPTFERDYVLENPHGLEQIVLRRFSDSMPQSDKCNKCGAPKPPVGRPGKDGITEVRHLACYPELPAFFECELKIAQRIQRDAAWQVNFDPLELHPNNFVPVREWRQPPLMDSSEYKNNTCNVLCVRRISAKEVIDFLNNEWEKGTVHLRKALSDKFGENVCNANGTPSPKAKGTGISGEREAVLKKMFQMTRISDVTVLLLTVRKLGILYAYKLRNNECL
jgi:hypothetical protein